MEWHINPPSSPLSLLLLLHTTSDLFFQNPDTDVPWSWLLSPPLKRHRETGDVLFSLTEPKHDSVTSMF
jgi:hypothetical protein